MKALIPQFIQEQFEANKTTGSLTAYTMFIDLSGFTAMTEKLMQKGKDGAEHLSILLNEIFEPMVSVVYAKGGFIPYFAGDAFTAIFPIELIAENVFIEISFTFKELFAKRLLHDIFFIGIKIGLAKGRVDWGIVGDAHQSFYFTGEAINNCAMAQSLAKQQQIFAHQSFTNLNLFKPQKNVENYVELTFCPHNIKHENKTILPPFISLKKSVATLFLPHNLLQNLPLGEFRAVVSIFISFENIFSHAELNEFASIILNEINNFSGYFKEIDFSDKGGVIVCFFGAPTSFENNPERALSFVLVLAEHLKNHTSWKYRIGMTLGNAFAGIVGGKARCQYALVGTPVNLAARIMSKAAWGEILVDETLAKHQHFNFYYKDAIRYKGIEGEIPTYQLLSKSAEQMPIFSGDMIGRKAELANLRQLVYRMIANQHLKIVSLYGEAGIGKSRLAYELNQQIDRTFDRIAWLTCRTDQILKKPFNPFLYLFKNYFQQSPENTHAQNQHNFEIQFAYLLHEASQDFMPKLLAAKLPLAALLGLDVVSEIWEQLDAQARYQQTLDAISNFLKAKATRQPLILEIEDAHWFDNNSKEFLAFFINKAAKLPILLLITSRYSDDNGKIELIEPALLAKNQVENIEIDLGILQPDDLKNMATHKLGANIDADFQEFLQRTTNGNPFYMEQILEYLIESHLVTYQENHWIIKDKQIKLSTSINAILMARIDRLSSLVKETVKAAAVIGREFEVSVLSEVMKEQTEFIRHNGDASLVLREQIQSAERNQIWQAMNELRYIFKHSLLREAIYDMQLRTHLRILHHLIGEAIERLYAENLDEKYIDLAFHYEQAENYAKARYYWANAAEHARRNYQNQQAINFYNKLILDAETNDRLNDAIKFLFKKGQVLELIGVWQESEEIYQKALFWAKKQQNSIFLGRAHNYLGNLSLLRGDYVAAKQYLEKALEAFEIKEDLQGISKVYGTLGNLYFRQGRYEHAKNYFERCLSYSKTLDETTTNAQIVANLGLTYMNQGNFDEGIKCMLDHLILCSQLQEKQGMGTLNVSIGIVYLEKNDFNAALPYFQRALTLSEELSNKLLSAIAIGNIGIVYERRGDYTTAKNYYEKDLTLCEQLGDKQGISIALGLLGEFYNLTKEYDLAIQFSEKNLLLCEQLNYMKGIAKASNSLGDAYTAKQDIKQALHYYDKAIEVAKNIDNKLLLNISLDKRGGILAKI